MIYYPAIWSCQTVNSQIEVSSLTQTCNFMVKDVYRKGTLPNGFASLHLHEASGGV